MAVSFARQILPFFRPIDIQHMRRRGVLLDDYAYMSDPAGNVAFTDHSNARIVYANVSPTSDPPNPPAMPPNGPYWSADQLHLYEQWMADGFQA
jgi:hypothetical protein